MTTRSAAAQKTAEAKPAGQPESTVPSKKLTAYYLGPACEHHWSKLTDDHQTMLSEGKIIWQCRGCEEIAITYDWQTPSN